MFLRIFSNNSIRVIIIVLVLAIVLVPVTAFCGGCGETKKSNTFTELLGLVPAEAAEAAPPVCFVLIDYASFYRDNDITFTTIEDLVTEIKKKPHEVFMNMPGEGSFITGYSPYAEHSTIKKQYVGYDVGDVDAEILFGTSPAEGVSAIGRFNPEATKEAFNNRDEWPDWAVAEYATEEYQGVTIHSWGDGFKMHFTPQNVNSLCAPHIDSLGRAMPLAVTDKYLFYHPSQESVRKMIDASQKKRKSLEDLPEYTVLIDHLEKYHIYSVVLGNAATANFFISDIRDSKQLTEENKGTRIAGLGTPLKKFLTCGCGSGYDKKGTFAIFVVYHENSNDARENVPLFKQRLVNQTSLLSDKSWAELVKDFEIEAHGQVMIARLYTDSPALRSSWIFSHDNLLYHEE